jgi:hypothetical protein
MMDEDGPRIVKFALGENVTQANFSARGNRYPITRMGVESVIRQAFSEAQEYAVARRNAGNDPFRRDIRLDALNAILDGGIWIHSHCYRADEILRLLAVAEDFGVRVAALQHVLEGYRIVPEMVRHGVSRVDVFGLVGVQTGSVRRDSTQRGDDDARRRRVERELGLRRRGAVHEPRSGQDDAVRRPDRGRGDPVDYDQSRDSVGARRPDWDRSSRARTATSPCSRGIRWIRFPIA